MIDESKYSTTNLVIAHWLYERELEEEESEDARKLFIAGEDIYIEEVAGRLQQMYNNDTTDQLYMAILGEYHRQHPYYDGKWWLEGRPWNMTKKEFERQQEEIEERLKEPVEEPEKPKRYSEYILKMLRQNFGYEEDDTSHDEVLQEMSPKDVFARVCEWDGLINYSYKIKGWVEAIYGINLEEIEQNKNGLGETHFF